MEFGFRAVDGRATPLTESLPGVTNVAVGRPSLQRRELGQIGFSGNFPSPVPERFSGGGIFFQQEMEIREQIRREIEKDEIRKHIIAGEIAAARRRELEEEVRREMAMERGLLIQQQLSTNLNQGMNAVVDNAKIFGTLRSQLPYQVDNNKDKVIVLARPNVNVSNAKDKAVATPAVTSLQIKPKHRWSCELCGISTTCEEGLNDHFRGRKHRAKEALRAPKIGFDPRPRSRPQPLIPLLHRHIIPTQIGMPKRETYVNEDQRDSKLP